MSIDLTTNEHQALLGTFGASFGLREVGVETENFVLAFALDSIDLLLCIALYTRNPSVNVHFNAFDALIGFGFDLVVPRLA